LEDLNPLADLNFVLDATESARVLLATTCGYILELDNGQGVLLGWVFEALQNFARFPALNHKMKTARRFSESGLHDDAMDF
jgi:hypothetical protein